MSRVQVTQILGLLRLAPAIQQRILGLSPTDTNCPIPKHPLMRLSDRRFIWRDLPLTERNTAYEERILAGL